MIRPFLERVVETMVTAHAARGHAAFAFTAPCRRAGTTYVVDLLAGELTRQYHCSVAIVPSRALKRAEPKKLPQGYIERTPNIWAAIPDADLESLPDHSLERVWTGTASSNFDFVLLDCPALSAAPNVLRYAAAADGAFLVIEAGHTRVEQIERAQSLFASGSARLDGIILNRRTYAIPNFLYRLL